MEIVGDGRYFKFVTIVHETCFVVKVEIFYNDKTAGSIFKYSKCHYLSND